MPAEIINLRRARKARTRAEKERQSEQNRALFGQPRADRQRRDAEADLENRRHEAHRRPDVDRKDGDEPEDPA